MSPATSGKRRRRRASTIFSGMESPGLISPIARGIACNSPVSSGMCGKEVLRQVPLTNKALGAGISGLGKQLLEVSRRVHIQRNAGEPQFYTGIAGSLRGGTVWNKTVVSEAHREKP